MTLPRLLLVGEGMTAAGEIRAAFDKRAVIDFVSNPEDAVLSLEEVDYAAIVLSTLKASTSALDLLVQVRKRTTTPLILVLGRGDSVDRVIGLEMGADAVLIAPVLGRELIARLRAMVGRVNSTPKRHQPGKCFAGILILEGKRCAEWRGHAISLTKTEYNLLDMLVSAQGDAVDKGQLSRKGVGKELLQFDRRVDIHIGNLRRKIEATCDSHVLIKTVRGWGYALVELGDADRLSDFTIVSRS